MDPISSGLLLFIFALGLAPPLGVAAWVATIVWRNRQEYTPVTEPNKFLNKESDIKGYFKNNKSMTKSDWFMTIDTIGIFLFCIYPLFLLLYFLYNNFAKSHIMLWAALAYPSLVTSGFMDPPIDARWDLIQRDGTCSLVSKQNQDEYFILHNSGSNLSISAYTQHSLSQARVDTTITLSTGRDTLSLPGYVIKNQRGSIARGFFNVKSTDVVELFNEAEHISISASALGENYTLNSNTNGLYLSIIRFDRCIDNFS